MKKRHKYMSALNILDWIDGNKILSIRKSRTDDKIFDGKASEILVKKENKSLKDKLDQTQLLYISAEGNTIILGVE